jgi:hypothetical protein
MMMFLLNMEDEDEKPILSTEGKGIEIHAGLYGSGSSERNFIGSFSMFLPNMEDNTKISLPLESLTCGILSTIENAASAYNINPLSLHKNYIDVTLQISQIMEDGEKKFLCNKFIDFYFKCQRNYDQASNRTEYFVFTLEDTPHYGKTPKFTFSKNVSFARNIEREASFLFV